MQKRRSAGGALSFAFAGLLLAGCPQLLDDNFENVHTDKDASAGGGSDGSAASGGTGKGGSGGVSGQGGSGGLDGSEASPCSACAAGETCCDNQCANTQTNSTHCGACGVGCPGTTCVSGACTNMCLLAHLDCDQNAVTGCEVDAATDTENCGSCGAKCGFDQTCDNGKCVCPAGSGNCDNDLTNGCETNLATDANNCSACGKSCGPNQLCTASACTCAPGFGDCNNDKNDGCEVDLKTSTQNCNACGNDCGVNSACSGGVCGCVAGFQECNAAVLGCETAKNDASNCGTCGIKCDVSTPVCNGTTCVVQCLAPTTKCGSSCVDTNTDPLNCGSCGKAVLTNQKCVNGVPTCLTGWGDCDGNPGNGCETDVTGNESNCGSCNNKCKPGAVCSASTCQCATATPNDCGSACKVCCTNADCIDQDACTTDVCGSSGTCSHTNCAAGTHCCALGCFECCDSTQCGGLICSGNQCVLPTCVSPEILCNTTCINPTNDSNNCGGCGIQCGIGRTCVSGNCSPPWAPVGTPNAPSARSHAAYVAMTGLGKVFVWGGLGTGSVLLDTGAIYDVATNTWTIVQKDASTPTPRLLATAVFIGDQLFVWGGSTALTGGTDLNDGAIYDPSNGSWTPVSTVNAPSQRHATRGVWTGSRVLIWGGLDATGGALADAFSYDPGSKLWSPANNTNAPSKRLDPTVGWTGTDLYVYGGRQGSNFYDELYRFSVSGNAWTKLSGAGVTPRFGALGGWDGTVFVAWGGHATGSTIFNDGARYAEASGWSNLASGGPSARYAQLRDHGWSFRTSNGNMLLLGGYTSAVTIAKDGAVYSSSTNKWTPVPAWTANEDHHFGVAAWADVELLLWGGLTGTTPTATGERYRP